jgi:integrase
MICMIYRRKRTMKGKTSLARLYRGRYRLEGDRKISDIPLHTADKRVAQELLKDYVRDKQMEKAGMIPPEAIRKAAQSDIQGHLSQYVADLNALNRDIQYVKELNNRVLRLIRDCKWEALRDVTSDSFQCWRAKQNRSPKTLNEYLGSMSSFLSWMEKHERIAKNPLKNVQKVQTNGKQTRPRRAFTDDEMGRLLQVAGKRRVLYLTAVMTGLRRSELKTMDRDDVHLEPKVKYLNVRASTTKNHKQAIMALHPDASNELASLLETLPKSEQAIFADLMPNMDQFRADLKAAGIEFINAKGLRADFHSLRHTLATNLAKAGTAPRVAMEIMRHSDMRLTAKTYTDAGQLPIADAVLQLPSLIGSKTRTQIGTQSLVPEGQNGSTPVIETRGASESQDDENQTVVRDRSGPDRSGQKREKMGRTGFEPVRFKVA